jgi:hypothetical protein
MIEHMSDIFAATNYFRQFGMPTTLWSCVAELTTRHICYAAGAPGVMPFEDIPALA